MRDIIGCCNSFKKCSDAGRCIHETDTRLHGVLDYENCLYKENIDKGLNFYTEYNDNNRARAEEYRSKIEKNVEEVKSVPMENKQTNKTYIEIFNRLLSIGKRSDYNGYTYNLSTEDKEQVIAIIKNYGMSCSNIKDLDKFMDEVPENDEYCNCKIIITLDNQNYNIANYNDRGLKMYTAKKVVNFLAQNNIDADIEVIKNFSGKRVHEKSSVVRDNPVKEKEIKNRTNYGQMSFFEML